jgi:ATP-dependent DNA helicase PIF1
LSQIPLIYAWAVTIHKAQGATLQCAQIDIGNDVFECGQSYVALSRVVDVDGLYLTSFDASKIKVNPKVVAYYNC